MSSRRHGVVYTKRWVVDFVLDVLGYKPGSGIINKVIVEPSCGEGAFLEAIVDRLADDALETATPWESLAESIRAYDIDASSLEKARAVAVKVLVGKGCPADAADSLVRHWLVCGDFLLNDVPTADFVVGNPPYIRSAEIDKEKREIYCKRLSSVTRGCDLYISFFDRGLDVLRGGGALCFICADRWLQNTYGKRLRQRVGMECGLEALIRMHGVDAFDSEVDAYPAITLIRNASASGALHFVDCKEGFIAEDAKEVLTWLSAPSDSRKTSHFEAFEIARPRGGAVYPLGSSEQVEFVSRCCETLPSFEHAGIKLGIGVATGCDEVFLTEDANLVESSRQLPLFYMRDYRRGHRERERWLVNPWDENGSLVSLEDYPKLKKYLESHGSRLRNRHVARKNSRAWYRTIDKVMPGLMDRDLLLMPDMAASPDPILSRGKYPHHNCYWISSDVWDLRVLGGILMSDIVKNFVDTLGVKMRGGTLRFQAQYLRLLHVPPYENISLEMRQGLAEAFEEADRSKASKCAREVYEGVIR